MNICGPCNVQFFVVSGATCTSFHLIETNISLHFRTIHAMRVKMENHWSDFDVIHYLCNNISFHLICILRFKVLADVASDTKVQKCNSLLFNYSISQCDALISCANDNSLIHHFRSNSIIRRFCSIFAWIHNSKYFFIFIHLFHINHAETCTHLERISQNTSNKNEWL